MIYSVIKNGIIENNVTVENLADWGIPVGCTVVENTEDYHIGGTYVDGVYTPPVDTSPVINPVPQTISDRQFFQQLSVLGVISEDDALASNAAVIPAPLMTLINSLPVDQQFPAKMLIGGSTIFERNHPLTIALGTAYGWTSEQIDNLFIEAAKL